MNVGKAIKALDKKIVLAVVKAVGGDGHTIFDPSKFTDAGLSEELVAEFLMTHESDLSDPKRTITDRQNRILPALRGVYGLTLIERFAHEICDFSSWKSGRGFRAAHCCEILRNHYKEGT